MNKIEQILISSGNKGKLVEIADLLGKIGIEAISAADFNLEEPEETGKNFEENSKIKARYYGDKTGLISLADDSGLCIDALNGEPGIHSARWAIDEQTGEKNFNLAFEKIKQSLIAKNVVKNINLETAKITAHFICNLTLYNPKTSEIKSFEGRVDGFLVIPPKGNNGFGYDPIFITEGFDKTFGEMLPAEKDKVSHRTRAFEKILEFLELS